MAGLVDTWVGERIRRVVFAVDGAAMLSKGCIDTLTLRVGVRAGIDLTNADARTTVVQSDSGSGHTDRTEIPCVIGRGRGLAPAR